MPFNEELPEWKKDNPDPTPPQEKKDRGWVAGERPPASMWNWFANRTYTALKQLFEYAIHKETLGKPGGPAVLDENGKLAPGQENAQTIKDASTTQKGIVQLSNKTNGTSQTLATTEKALKEVLDALTTHAKTENHMLTNGGLLSGNIDFNSPSLANKIHVIGEVGSGSTNPPPESYGILTAPTPVNYGYDTQEYTVVTSGNKYYKVKSENGWKPWRKVLTDADVRPSASGTYTGNSATTRKIELGFTPSMVTIFKVNLSNGQVVEVFHLISEGSLRTISGSASQSEKSTYITTGGFVVEGVFANTNGYNYKYIATP